MNITTIEELNAEEAKQHIGGVVFVAILMIVGFVGNLHVLIVYAFFMKPSNHRIFILVLGTLDFITCIIGMPFIIVDLRNPLTFTLSSACKILRFINYFICSASALTLIIIATDRYRKICVPFGKQITQKVASLLCGLMLFVAMLLSWPAPILFGIRRVETGTNLTGTRCWTEDKPNYDDLQAYFNVVLILCVFIVFVVLVVLYTLIGRVISKQNSFKRRENGFKSPIPAPSQTTRASSTSELSNVGDELPGNNTRCVNFIYQGKMEDEIRPKDLTTCDSNVNKSSAATREPPTHHEENNGYKDDQSLKGYNRAKRTALIFFLITVIFFLSYFPHLTLIIIDFVSEDFVQNLSFHGKVFYNTFLWSFFINNVANCFVYSFFDKKFRQEVKNVYRKFAFWKAMA
ncbi:hypothetical protein ACF0H5_002413 [Mactra antiquata]